MTGTPARILAIATLLIAGVLAGTQLGKVSPLIGWYRDEIGFSLVLIGWFTAMIGFFVAIAALPAGIAIEKIGTRKSVAVSSAVLVAGGVALALSTSPLAILAARLVEGLGYLVLVIALPALLATLSPPRWRAPVLAMWGGFVPVGFAISDFLATFLDAAHEPRRFLMVAVLLYGAMALAGSLLAAFVPDSADQQASQAPTGRLRETLTLPIVLVSLAFGLYVVLSVGFFAFLPAFAALPATSIALSAGIVALVTPLGNLAASLAVRGGTARRALWLAAAGFAIIVASAWPTFSPVGDVLATAGAVSFAFACGIIASALFAALPSIVPEQGSSAVAIGLICQAGGIGTVAGPPLAAQVIETLGWDAFGLFMAGVAIAGIASLLPLMSRRQESA